MSFGPTSREATPQEVNAFVVDVDAFMAKYAKLVSPAMQEKVYESNDPEVISQYEKTLSQATFAKNSVESLTGAWLAFKREYAAVTGYTSTVIGDAVDWLRGIFGDDPYPGLNAYSVSPISGGQLGAYSVSPISGGQLGALGLLGAIPILTAVAVAGVAGIIFLSSKGMDKFFIWHEAKWIMENDPTISVADAIDKSSRAAARGGMFEGAALPLLAAAAIAAFLIFGKKK